MFLFSINASIENYLISQTIYSLGYGLIGIYLATKYEKFESTNFDKLSKYFNRIKKSYGKLRFDQILGLIPQHFDVIVMQQDEEYGNLVWDKHFGNNYNILQRH